MEQLNELFEIPSLFNKDPKKKEIDANMKKLGIKSSLYTINKDYTVDLTGTVAILVKKIEECPVNFNVCNGNFVWHFSDLKSMKNLPKIVKGNLTLANNKLTTLEDSQTTVVEGTFNVSNNKLKNLKGSPKKVGQFIAMNCGLESLEGGPEEVTNEFLVGHNNLTSLEGSPKKVGGLYDCSQNKLKNLIGITPLVKRIDKGFNPLDIEKKDEEPKKEKEKKEPVEQLEMDFAEWKEGDKIKYVKQGSKYNNMTGVIRTVEPPTKDEPEKTYNIYFSKIENPSLEKDGGIANGKARYLRKFVDTFISGDLVLYTNANSKYKGYHGKVDTVTDTEGELTYKVRFDYDDNPGIIDIVSQGNKNKTFVNVGKIKGEDLQRYKASELSSIASDTTETLPKEPIKPKDQNRFAVGDRIIYLDPGGEYDECKGRVTYAIWRGYTQVVDIDLTDKRGLRQSIMNVDTKKLEKDDSFKSEIPPPNIGFQNKTTKRPSKYKKGDKVVFISKLGEDKNKEFHMCKGEITYVNDYATETSYDVKFPKQLNVPVEKTIYLVRDGNIIPLSQEFKEGDKVVYDNEADEEYHGKPGIVTKVGEDQYDVTFNDGDSTMTIQGCLPGDLTKFIKPIGTECHEDDEVIYTKPDSKHYGCKGFVKAYNLNDEKPFEVEIKSKDGKMIKIKTKDENLEFVPPPRIFKKGDKIRYINSESPWDGLIGTVNKVSKPTTVGAVTKYDLILKGTKGTVSLTTTSDNIMLLEEASDDEGLKFGQAVKYTNPTSKYNGRVGEYQGTRDKDGKKQYSVKFDDGNIWRTIYFDEGEGTIEASNEPLPKSTTVTPATTATYSTGYTAPAKKKKKKEPEPERKPVLVYNRRHVAKKAYKKPGSEPEKVESEETEPEKPRDFKIGDRVKILSIPDGLAKRLIGEIGEITTITYKTDGTKRYGVKVDTRVTLGEQFKADQLEYIKKGASLEKGSSLEIGDKVIITNSVSKDIIGKEGTIKELENRDKRYEIKVDRNSYFLTRDQFKEA